MIVVHKLKLLYYIAAIFPILSVFSCWAIYYPGAHNTRKALVTISESVLYFPENRIFAVTMNLEAWILYAIFFIRNRAISTFASINNKESTLGFQMKVWYLWFATYAIPIALAVLAAVTLEDQKFIHLFCAFIFFVGSVVNNILSDMVLIYVGIRVKIVSQAISWLTLGVLLLYMVFMPLGTRATYATGVIGQYLTAILIFIKLIFSGYDLPSHQLSVSKKEE